MVDVVVVDGAAPRLSGDISNGVAVHKHVLGRTTLRVVVLVEIAGVVRSDPCAVDTSSLAVLVVAVGRGRGNECRIEPVPPVPGLGHARARELVAVLVVGKGTTADLGGCVGVGVASGRVTVGGGCPTSGERCRRVGEDVAEDR